MADEDLAGRLPPAPPLAPARREAAIEAALRRFDGEPAPAPAPPPRRRWGTPPQLGALAAASLALVVGVPLAWQGERVREPAAPTAEVAVQDVAAPPAAEPPPPAEAPPPAAAKPAAPEEAQADAAIAPPAIVALPPGIVAAPAAPAVVAPGAPPPPPPPPPPPAPAASRGFAVARESAAEMDGLNDVVVTGARRRADGFSVDACTLDDPRQRLDLCRDRVDPAAPGREGRAAARTADGLTRGWVGDEAGAIRAFDQAIAASREDAFAYLNRGLARQRQGDLTGALADLDRAVRYAPRSAQAHYRRGLLLREMGDETRARAALARAHALDRRYPAP